MLLAAIALFALAALGGITMAGMRFSGRAIPLPLAIGHGLVAATALILLIAQALSAGGLLGTAAFVFVLAALGGLTLFSFHLRGRTLPVPLILIHGGVAITGFCILLYAAFAS